MPNNSINTEELLRSEEGDPRSEDDLGLDDSIEVDSPSQHQPSKQSYGRLPLMQCSKSGASMEASIGL